MMWKWDSTFSLVILLYYWTLVKYFSFTKLFTSS